jgi:hypothetical protein
MLHDSRFSGSLIRKCYVHIHNKYFLDIPNIKAFPEDIYIECEKSEDTCFKLSDLT